MPAEPPPPGAPPQYDVFLSYHSRDREPVAALAQALRAHGLRVFLDRWYLHPGRAWPQELEAVLRACGDVPVCMATGSAPCLTWRGDLWCIPRRVSPIGPATTAGEAPRPC